MSVDPTGPSALASGLMQRLRDETADLHGAAESHPFQKSLVSGQADPATFTRWVGQMLHVHRALEQRLLDLRDTRPELSQVIREELFQSQRLEADLSRMNAGPEAGAPLPAVAAFVDRIEQLAATDALALLGILYVLEGSKNGNRFIARALERGAPGGFALGYLDPHGEEQRGLWQRFKLDMDALGLETDTQSRLVGTARETFVAVTRLSQELVGSD